MPYNNIDKANDKIDQLFDQLRKKDEYIETLKEERRQLRYNEKKQERLIDKLKNTTEYQSDKIDRLIEKLEKKDDYIDVLKSDFYELKKDLKDEKLNRYLEKKHEYEEAKRIQKSKSTDEIGDEGEDSTTATIKRLKDLGYPLNGIRFYFGRNNNTVEIDHIFVSNRGVFVFETKNWNAEISGDVDDITWTYKNASLEKDIYSPIAQNNNHIYQLRKVAGLEDDVEVYNVIVFSGNTTFSLSENKDYFLKPDEIRNFIESKKVIYDDTVVKEIYKKINDSNKPITHEEHVENIKNRKLK
jgi:hypothetical protein